MGNLYGHICIEGSPQCSAEGCKTKIVSVESATLLFSHNKILIFCSDECHDKTFRDYIKLKDERKKLRKELSNRNLLKELSYTEAKDTT